MANILWKIISFIIPISVVLCMLLFGTNKRFRFFFPYAIFTTVIIFIEKRAFYLANKSIYNVWLYNYETVIEFGLHIWLVSQFLFNRKLQKAIRFFVIAFLIVGFYRCLTVPNDYTFDNWVYYIGSFALMVISAYYFFELLLYPNELSLVKMPSFWFCTGVLLFNSFTFTYFGISELLTQIPRNVLNQIELAKTIAYLFTYILFCIAFICQIKIKKLLPSL